LVFASGIVVAGCGSDSDAGRSFDRPVPRIGRGPGYELQPAGRKAAAGEPVGALRCERRASRPRFGVHLEVFARRLDVVVPAGVGVAPPRVREGAYVLRGRCLYPLRTFEPTGLIEIDRGAELSLGQFFGVWGQPLGRRRLLGFRAAQGEQVAAYVNGRRWRRDPRRIPLERHAAIVLEIGGYFPPTKRYVFPAGL
jgi:hypothetical protein